MTATMTRVRPPAVSQTKLLIDGRWVESKSGKRFTTFNPVNEEPIAEVAYGGPEDVDAAVRAAARAFEGPWRKMDARDRGRLLYKLADLVESNLDELAALETLDNGKPITDSRTGDLPLVVDCLRYYAGWADKIHGQTAPIRGNYFCYVKREPVGVCGQIIPWNFPLLMAAWKWGPALAAGCTLVLKPAEQTPLTALRLGELAMEAGFPNGVVNIVPGYGDTGAALVRHPRVEKIAFTGHYSTAQIIAKEAAETLKRLTFELGGKSPNIVFADADLDAAVEGAYVGIFLNQGQCCCAGSRLFVERKMHDDLLDRIVAKSKSRKVGDPFDPATEQGPQVDKDQFDKIMGLIEKGKSQGAECVAGGRRVGDKGFFVEPTVFANVRDDMEIAREEIFGPVLSVIPFDSIDEVVERGNSTYYGLAAAVWTRDVGKAHAIADRLRAGTVWVNCYDVFDAAAPFGGFKMSGHGRELGPQGLDNYLEWKTVTVNLA
jgi:aldehyde dehydrogenase (NAD+)